VKLIIGSSTPKSDPGSLLPRIQNTPYTAPDSSQPAPENPLKRPDLGAIRKSVIRRHFAEIPRICPRISIAISAVFPHPAYIGPIKGRSATGDAIAAVSGGGRNPAVLRAYLGGKTEIWGGFFTTKTGFPYGTTCFLNPSNSTGLECVKFGVKRIGIFGSFARGENLKYWYPSMGSNHLLSPSIQFC